MTDMQQILGTIRQIVGPPSDHHILAWLFSGGVEQIFIRVGPDDPVPETGVGLPEGIFEVVQRLALDHTDDFEKAEIGPERMHLRLRTH